jgi:hypothetical protein
LGRGRGCLADRLPTGCRRRGRACIGACGHRGRSAELADLLFEGDSVLAELVRDALEEGDRAVRGWRVRYQSYDRLLRTLIVPGGELGATNIADVVLHFGSELPVHQVSLVPSAFLLDHEDELPRELIHRGAIDG